MFGFAFCLYGQFGYSWLPKDNPRKRVTDNVTKYDSIHYFYSTTYDTLASVVVKNHFAPESVWLDSIFYDSRDRAIARNFYQKDSTGSFKIRFKMTTDYDDLTYSQILFVEGYSISGTLDYLTKQVKTYYLPGKI